MGRKMGPRPADFDENAVKESPTYLKWLELKDGKKMNYSGKEFTKGKSDDEERLMRRIMIARRNNLKDHETLKRAREANNMQGDEENTASKKHAPDDKENVEEMDEPAVVATRSYKAWLELADGTKFVYNQTYIKGKEGHDWLLKKNIWRRMRYRRENKKLLEKDTGAGGVSGVADEDDFLSEDEKPSASLAAAAPVHMHSPLEAVATAATSDFAMTFAGAGALQMEGV